MSNLRPSLAALAAAPKTITVRRLWKALTPEEKTLGITASFNDDENGWVKNSTRVAVAAALRFRPQTVATWPRTKLISEAARLPLDEAQLLGAYLIDLHLGHRRPMMAAFLNALGIENDEGRIDSEKTGIAPQDAAKISAAADGLATTYPLDEVAVYLLTLSMQDPAIWAGAESWLSRA